MRKSIACGIAALALAGTFGAGSARADEPIQVSGTDIATQVELHFIPIPGNPMHGLSLERSVGGRNGTGPFASMQMITGITTNEIDLNQGTGKVTGYVLGSNSEGTVLSRINGKSSFIMDDKTKSPKGAVEGVWEIVDGTGRFVNMRGKGTYKAEFGGGNFTTVPWSGTISGFERGHQHSDLSR